MGGGGDSSGGGSGVEITPVVGHMDVCCVGVDGGLCSGVDDLRVRLRKETPEVPGMGDGGREGTGEDTGERSK